MLIEMVSLALAVVSGISPLSGVFQVHPSSSATITSPIPPQALESSIPEEKLVSMLIPASPELTVRETEDTITITTETTPEPSPTENPSPTPTATSTPTPVAQPKITVTPTPQSPTPTDAPTPTPQPQPIVAPGELDSLFSRFADEYHVDKEQLKRIAICESGFNQEATNGDYLGMFQYAATSWSSIRARMGADTNTDLRKNAEESIKTTAYHIANGGQGAWPSCK